MTFFETCNFTWQIAVQDIDTSKLQVLIAPAILPRSFLSPQVKPIPSVQHAFLDSKLLVQSVFMVASYMVILGIFIIHDSVVKCLFADLAVYPIFQSSSSSEKPREVTIRPKFLAPSCASVQSRPKLRRRREKAVKRYNLDKRFFNPG
ncbi:hypothetical protein RHMOL_Rhmol04G0287500 [Rhododendron molle]|uniref:Uncharacterized protein n=1 Tax=Rhododendron molle TaxID=49168 RepID=A0ACC0P7W2_RHOML|nr:hypothetical protein RHMOL_Rhmol04G0287500 [Rhododendron molle]